MTTLKPLFRAMGWHASHQQRAAVKLLERAGAFGELPEVGVAGLMDAQADAILDQVDFPNGRAAVDWLHAITQAHLLRPSGVERADTPESPRRDALLPLLEKLGQRSARHASARHYDHVLVMGAMEGAVNTRLRTLQALHDEGVTFKEITLLGSARALDARHEPSARTGARTETEMMRKRFAETTRLGEIRVTEINTPAQADGSRANTEDTLRDWLRSKPEPGSVLVISDQPQVDYQEAVARKVLPQSFSVDVAGAAASPDMKASVAGDALARRIDAGLPELRRRMAIEEQVREIVDGQVAIRPEVIRADPAAYQFRKGGDAGGVTQAARVHATEWNPVEQGDLLLHQRKNGEYYVVDGHHRVGFLKELMAEGKAPSFVSAKILREEDGYSVQDARLIGAMVNIAHGHASVAEAARVLKEAESPGVHKELLPKLDMAKGNLPQALALKDADEPSLAVADYVEARAKAAGQQLTGAVARLLAERSAGAERAL